MSEPRKLNIDGGIAKEDTELTATYKAIPETDTDFKTSSNSLSKADKENGVADGADEKLLAKEAEAKIMTRVDMADAKYIVGDHRNGDANIEIDAAKKTFTGLTKEELLKYADDPFWVRLRWFMFILFWSMWFFMLAGAIAIIIQAPKCSKQPAHKKWYQKGPLIEMTGIRSFKEAEENFHVIKMAKAEGVFFESDWIGESYIISAEENYQPSESIKTIMTKAKEDNINPIMDITANYIHKGKGLDWFEKSEKKEEPYKDYFIWAPSTGYAPDGSRIPPNNWVSTLGQPAWSWSDVRQEFYLHQFDENQPDLNFRNPKVVSAFDAVLKWWMKAGASGVRLENARLLFVDPSFANESFASAHMGAVHTDYDFYSHKRTRDQPELTDLLAHWKTVMEAAAPLGVETLFMLKEPVEGARELLLGGGARPQLLVQATAAPALLLAQPVDELARMLNKHLYDWPIFEFGRNDSLESQQAMFSMLLPATPLFRLNRIALLGGGEWQVLQGYAEVVELRSEPALVEGHYIITVVPDTPLLICARWKEDSTGYIVIWNSDLNQAQGDLSFLPALPDEVNIYAISADYPVQGITKNSTISSKDVQVTGSSSIVLSFTPKAS